MKKSRCPHDRVYRVRGPRVEFVERREFDPDDDGVYEVLEVVEVCMLCGWRREIGFMGEGR